MQQSTSPVGGRQNNSECIRNRFIERFLDQVNDINHFCQGLQMSNKRFTRCVGDLDQAGEQWPVAWKLIILLVGDLPRLPRAKNEIAFASEFV